MSKLQEEIKRLMLQEEKELPEANPVWMRMKIELFSNEQVFDRLARCAGYVPKVETKLEVKTIKKSKKRKWQIVNLGNLQHLSQVKSNPDNNRIIKRGFSTKKILEIKFPFANLSDKLIRKLNANSKAYEKNFKLMWKYRNKDNSEFMEIEKKLNRKDIAIRKEMMIYISGEKSTKKYKLGEVI